MLPFELKYRRGHPENYSFSLATKIFTESKYPKNNLFKSEKGSAACNPCSHREPTSRAAHIVLYTWIQEQSQSQVLGCRFSVVIDDNQMRQLEPLLVPNVMA